MKVSYAVERRAISIYIWYWKSLGAGWRAWETESRQKERKEGLGSGPAKLAGWKAEGEETEVNRTQAKCVLKHFRSLSYPVH